MTAEALRARLQGDLRAAMRARQGRTVALLRALAAALDNAEAVPLPAHEESDALRMAGGAPSETARRELAAEDIAALLERERSERLAAAEQYAAIGKLEDAARLRSEAELVARYR